MSNQRVLNDAELIACLFRLGVEDGVETERLKLVQAIANHISDLELKIESAKELARYVCIHGNSAYAPLAEQWLRDVLR